MDSASHKPVLILGAGINGAALARELVLNGVPVCLVERNDVAFGASSRSTRLIHGGLRYLEYGDFRLVKESLRERARLRKLAPQFVKPLRLYIPVRRRLAGLFQAAFRFLGGSRFLPLYRLSRLLHKQGEHGLWLVRIGLWLYDRFAGDAEFPPHSVSRVNANASPRIDAARYRWMCAYTDAQMQYPERFILALLEDARQLAEDGGVDFKLFTYHFVELQDHKAIIRRIADDESVETLEPAAVVNATGAWGDHTLEDLEITSRQLFGGTKGSHLVTFHKTLREAIGNDGVYGEAEDGRLIFVLPFGEGTLVGTTDERFEQRPEQAVASQEELDYLIGMTNALFPQVNLTQADVELHYSGIRPLPRVTGGKTAAVSRDHFIERHDGFGFPVFTLVGGKLTTARSFAEEVADVLFENLGIEREADSRDRPVPGGENYPADEAAVSGEWERLSRQSPLTVEQIRALWQLCGNRVPSILDEFDHLTAEKLAGTPLPLDFVRWVIKHEWVATLEDLIERRLMLLYHPGLSRKTLNQLADCLIETGKLDSAQKGQAVQATIQRLHDCYGKQVVEG